MQNHRIASGPQNIYFETDTSLARSSGPNRSAESDGVTMKPDHLFRFLRRLRHARFLTISFLIHIIAIVLISGVVLFKAVNPVETFEVSGGIIQEESPVEEQIEAPEQEFEEEPAGGVSVEPAMSASAIQTLLASSNSITLSPGLEFQSAGTLLNRQLPSPDTSRGSSGAGNSNKFGPLSGRSGRERTARAIAGGQKRESEEAILRGLRWLKAKQNADGSWGANYRGAMTGLGLLAFLGHGETPRDSAEFGGTVAKAIDLIVREGENTGNLMFGAGKTPGVYQHGIATYAAAEAYAMTQDPRILTLLTKAVDVIIAGQGSDGGWMYGFSHEVPSDTSVSGWMIQALKTAKLAEVPHEGITPALDRALLNMERVFDSKTGSFGYRRSGDRGPGPLTGVGVLSIQFISGKSNASAREGLEAIRNLPDLDYKSTATNLYGWYYFTQACFQAQGSAWNKWNRMFQDELIRNQSPDGSWPPHGGKEPGNMNIQGTDPDVYRTALCVLMLEVYYRYSPVSKLASHE